MNSGRPSLFTIHGVTYVIFARAINTYLSQAIVARATESQKNRSKPP